MGKVKEISNAWDEIGLMGRLAFLFRSKWIGAEYPEDDERFLAAVDRFVKMYLEDLPGELQAEFAGYIEGRNLLRREKGGEKNDSTVQEGQGNKEYH